MLFCVSSVCVYFFLCVCVKVPITDIHQPKWPKKITSFSPTVSTGLGFTEKVAGSSVTTSLSGPFMSGSGSVFCRIGDSDFKPIVTSAFLGVSGNFLGVEWLLNAISAFRFSTATGLGGFSSLCWKQFGQTYGEQTNGTCQKWVLQHFKSFNVIQKLICSFFYIR